MNRVRYDSYSLSAKEWIMYLLTGIGIDAIISYLFYRSIIAFFIFLPFVGVLIKKKKKELMIKRQKDLELQFKEAIMSVSASLNAGYSIENAFVEATKDLKHLYGKRADIVKEFSYIGGRLAANETLEKILKDFAERSGGEDIKDFSDVFVTAKRSGGDLPAIIRRTAYHIGDKVEVKREINTLMSAKKMEQNIMSVIPFFIIFYVSLNSSGFLDALYHNFVGIVIMTICLGLYVFALFLAEKIISIEV